MGAVARLLPDGRLHLQHGPIDQIIGAEGAREVAFAAARARFETLLEELVAELPLLRRAVADVPTGAVARRMVSAVRPHGARFRISVAGLDGADLGRIDVGFAGVARGVATSG